ncbi:MAG: glycosyltransferase family 2 protein [Schleiferiaceae bacterium]
MSLKKLSVAILNWNGVALLERFIPKVLSTCPDWAEVVVIDNASTDDSVQWLQQNAPQVKVIQNSKNTGYAGGYNNGLSSLETEYWVLLNSDVEVSEGWLEPILEAFESNPSMAACQPKIKDLKNPSRFEYAGASGGFMDYLGYPFNRGRLFFTEEEDNGQYNDPIEVFWATGCCLCIRSQVFRDMKGFDESFFAHMEEIDLCWRMRIKGHSIQVIPSSEVYHLGGGTLDTQSTHKTFLNFRNNLYLLTKNLPQGQLFGLIFIRMILDGIAAINFVLARKPQHLLAILKAHFAFYGNFNRLMKYRITHKNSAKITSFPGVYTGSVVWAYFGKKQKYFSELSHRLFTK